VFSLRGAQQAFAWHDGVDFPPDVPADDFHVLPGFYMLSLELAVASYDTYVNDQRWHPGLSPAFLTGMSPPALNERECCLMAPRPQPGLAWYIVCDAGFAVGLVTHYLPKWGHLVWMADPVFDNEPTLEDVLAIRRWRWPVLFPLGAAIHRHIATGVGIVPIPARLQELPVMRSGTAHPGQRTSWTAVQLTDSGDALLGGTKDRSLPICQIVNDTRLREMIVCGWRSEGEW